MTDLDPASIYFIYLRARSQDEIDSMHEIMPTVYDTNMSFHNGDVFILYAITNQKSIVKDFLKCHKPHRFVYKEEDGTIGEYERIASEFPNLELRLRGLKTKRIRDGKIREDLALLSITGFEMNFVRLNGMTYLYEKFDSGLSDVWLSVTIDIFKGSYQTILKNIFQLDDMLSALYPNEELPWNPYYLDEVGIFIDAYSGLLNRKEVLRCAYTDTTERMLLQKKRRNH